MELTNVKKTACFIITYERPEKLLNSLRKIISQSNSPDYILIIDNSLTDKTENILQPFLNKKTGYLRGGYNSGPAGASKIGLKNLNDMRFNYIFWTDDDNPPRNSTFFDELFYGVKKLELKSAVWG